MKKIKYFILFILITSLSTAQETSTLKVIGKAIHIDNELIFKSTVSLSATYSSLPTDEESFSKMKDQYDEALKKNGLSLTNLEEDPIGYLYLGYEKKGMLYHFKTSSLTKFNNFLTSNSFGLLRHNYGYSFIISEKEASKVALEAIKNAKEKAQILAKASNKELGDIVHIEDNNIFNEKLINQSLYYDSIMGQYIYSITVTFELKDK